jgi:hypothetical protein
MHPLFPSYGQVIHPLCVPLVTRAYGAQPTREAVTDLVLGHPGIYSNLLELQHTIMYFITLRRHLTRAIAGLSS